MTNDQHLGPMFSQMIGNGLYDEGSGGDSTAPTGFFSVIFIDEDMIDGIREDIPLAENVSDEAMIGFWLYVENSDGYINLTKFDSAHDALEAFDELEAQYTEYMGDDEDGE